MDRALAPLGTLVLYTPFHYCIHDASENRIDRQARYGVFFGRARGSESVCLVRVQPARRRGVAIQERLRQHRLGTLMANRSERSWLQCFLTIRLGNDADSDEYRTGILVLRQIEAWLKDNHQPRSLFDRRGQPKSDFVSVAFAQDELDKAMAYRVFCNELGLGSALRHSRIFHNNCPRTTPRF